MWFTSDLHLGHDNVIKYCFRPFQNVTEMNEAIIENWNKLISPGELVYVLGDVSLAKPSIGIPLLYRLKGEKILIKGNHDGYSFSQYREAGFVGVFNKASMTFRGKTILLCHYPYLESKKDTRYPERHPKKNGYDFLIHGHVHNLWQKKETQINVGVDVWGFKPVSESQIAKLMGGSEE